MKSWKCCLQQVTKHIWKFGNMTNIERERGSNFQCWGVNHQHNIKKERNEEIYGKLGT